MLDTTKNYLIELYGSDKLDYIKEGISKINSKYDLSQEDFEIDQNEVFLITYADIIREKGVDCLKTFKKFADVYLSGIFTTVHFLPFYPYTSDDGFSVVDYKKIDTINGDWEDVKEISNDFRLMFDCVINHVSQKSEWFQKCLAGDEKYSKYFISFDNEIDTSLVFRPRTHPLLTKFSDDRYYWTTFSDDQLDLDFTNPDVFLEFLDIMCFYSTYGSNYFRFDAITYAYKNLKTNCVDLPEVHKLVKCYRDLLPKSTKIISEINMDRDRIISFFGDGHDESHVVYNFPLAPVAYYCMLSGDNKPLIDYFNSIKDDFSNDTTYLNFLSSHDGIGVVPAKGFLDDLQVDSLVQDAVKKGFMTSFKSNSDGSKSPYEININYFDAMDQNPQKMLCVHSILMFAKGIPAVYFHSFVGSCGDVNYDKTKPRSANREKLDFDNLVNELDDESSVRYEIISNMMKMIAMRRLYTCFHPHSNQNVVDCDDGILVVNRSDDDSSVTGYHNLTHDEKSISIDKNYKDLLTENVYKDTIVLAPYQYVWLVEV